MEEFEREEIRPGFRIGFTIDDLEEGSFEGAYGFERDEFQLDSPEDVEEDDELDDEESDESDDDA